MFCVLLSLSFLCLFVSILIRWKRDQIINNNKWMWSVEKMNLLNENGRKRFSMNKKRRKQENFFSNTTFNECRLHWFTFTVSYRNNNDCSVCLCLFLLHCILKLKHSDMCTCVYISQIISSFMYFLFVASCMWLRLLNGFFGCYCCTYIFWVRCHLRISLPKWNRYLSRNDVASNVYINHMVFHRFTVLHWLW